MVYLMVRIIQVLAQVFTLVLLADVVVSYFLSPYHPIRSFLDRLIQPLLRPIQRVLPTFGGIDFSPFVLLLLVQLAQSLLVNLIIGLG